MDYKHSPNIGLKLNETFFADCKYHVVVSFFPQAWDRSHFLENLSGYETQCAMILAEYWDFPYATEMGKKYGMNVMGLYGSARNRGSTPRALEEILFGFKSVNIRSAF